MNRAARPGKSRDGSCERSLSAGFLGRSPGCLIFLTSPSNWLRCPKYPMKFRPILIFSGGVLAATAFVAVMEQPAAAAIQSLVDRFGTRVIEEELEMDCLCCANHRRARILSWKIMGEEGYRTLDTSDTASAFMADFPGFNCRHYWVPESDEPPTSTVCGPAWGFARTYSENELVRERVLDELALGTISRGSVIERVEGEWMSECSAEQAVLDEIEHGKPVACPAPLPIMPMEPLVTGLPGH